MPRLLFGGVVVLIIMGILGWFMKSLGWPRPAFLLAFILGPVIEKFYFHSVMMYGTGWVMRPAVIVILVYSAPLSTRDGKYKVKPSTWGVPKP